MATLFLMCGLPGSGKTTLARRLERERDALRLTPDEWIARLYGRGLTPPALDWCRDPVEAVQWEVAERALRLGVNVILDFGFWSRAAGGEFRARAAALGAGSELHVLDVPRAELSARVAVRAGADPPPDAFPVTEAQLDAWWQVFEPQTAEEMRPRHGRP